MIYTIGDLHLSFKENKPMSIFGENWYGHDEKIKNDWISKVTEKDLVILLGDFSWAMYLKDTDEDFKYLNNLPGKKLLLKGNHDYWWNTVTKMKEFLKENNFSNIEFLYNSAYEFEGKVIVGTRGWALITKNTIINNELNEMLRILKKYDIKKCYYGHLHGNSIKEAVEGEHIGITFKLVSADGLDFKLVEVI